MHTVLLTLVALGVGPGDDIQKVYSGFDINNDGVIQYDEFLRVIKGEMAPNRVRLVEAAYKKLDKDGSGVVDIYDIRDVYNATKHPAVMEGRKTEDQILTEFLAEQDAAAEGEPKRRQYGDRLP